MSGQCQTCGDNAVDCECCGNVEDEIIDLLADLRDMEDRCRCLDLDLRFEQVDRDMEIEFGEEASE